jgi:hypothetical protein
MLNVDNLSEMMKFIWMRMANLFRQVRIVVVSYNSKIAEAVHVAAYHTQYEMACRGPHKRWHIEGFLLQGFNEVVLKHTKAHKNIVLFFLRHRLFFHWVLTRHILSVWSSNGGCYKCIHAFGG